MISRVMCGARKHRRSIYCRRWRRSRYSTRLPRRLARRRARWPDANLGWPGSISVAAREAAELPDAQRLRALERLTARAGERALPVLLPLLTDRDPGIRLFAARRLGRAGVPAAIDAATGWIATPNVPLVDRQFGLEVLREAPTLTEGARQAIELALRDADAAVRISALDTLERHDATPSLSAVLSALDDDNREVRLRAIRLLAGKRDPRIALPLLTHVEDADRQVRVDAIRALGSHPRATPALLRMLADPAEDVRNAAIDALAALHAEAAVPPFAALARKRPGGRYRAARAGRAGQGGDAGGDRGADRADAHATGLGGHPGRAARRRRGGGSATGARAGGRHARQRGDRRRHAGRHRGPARHRAALRGARPSRGSGAGRAGRARADRGSRRGPDAGARRRVGRSRDAAARASRRCWPSATRARLSRCRGDWRTATRTCASWRRAWPARSARNHRRSRSRRCSATASGTCGAPPRPRWQRSRRRRLRC